MNQVLSRPPGSTFVSCKRLVMYRVPGQRTVRGTRDMKPKLRNIRTVDCWLIAYRSGR